MLKVSVSQLSNLKYLFFSIEFLELIEKTRKMLKYVCKN